MEVHNPSIADWDKAKALGRAIVWVHLTSIAAFGVASYLDGTPGSAFYRGAYLGFAMFWGLLTIVACPLSAIWLYTTHRLTGRDAAVLLALTCVIEALQMFAMLPLVQ